MLSTAEQQAEAKADPNTRLAADRTILAAERTYAAWVRSGLAALASGIGTKTLLKELVPEWLILSTATLLVLFSGFCFAAAIWRETFQGIPPPQPHVRRIPSGLLIFVNGFLIVVTLAALVGIWTGPTGKP